MMLLDEPLAGTSGAEAACLTRPMSDLRGQVTPVLIEHDMEAVFALADRISVLVQARVLDLFPRLPQRLSHRGSQLSGGEQQMLAIGRALMTNPRLLVLDEATEGLAPLVRDQIWACLTALKGQGLAILIVDKNLSALTRLADRHVVIVKGRTVWSGDNAELCADPTVAERHLAV